jgi:PAS domain S-box-containing protein
MSAGAMAASPSSGSPCGYDTTFDQAPVGIIHFDTAGRPLRVNPELCSMLGYSCPELVERFFDLVHPLDRERLVGSLGRVFNKQTTTTVWEARICRSDGQWLWGRINLAIICPTTGEAPYLAAVVLDITKRKDAEHALRTTSERLATVVDHAPIILWAVDNDGIVTVSQGKALAALGLAPGSNVGRYVFDLYTDVPEVAESVRRGMAGETVSIEIDVQGAIFDSYITPLRGPGGEIVGAMGVATDITARKRFEDALVEARRELEARVDQRTAELSAANESLREQIAERRRAERELRAERHLMEQLLAAHERDRQLVAYEIHDSLVQDITGALMHLEACWEAEPGDDLITGEEFEQGLELLRGAIAESRRLISGLRPPIIDELGIVAAIDYLVHEKAQASGIEIAFAHQVHFKRLAPLLEGAIYRIVQEALTNVTRHSQADEARVELSHHEDRIFLEVRDWGVGFDPNEVTEHRFGLKGIRERARLLRGRAEVLSAPGKGTRIVVHLPITHAIQFNEGPEFPSPSGRGPG